MHLHPRKYNYFSMVAIKTLQYFEYVCIVIMVYCEHENEINPSIQKKSYMYLIYAVLFKVHRAVVKFYTISRILFRIMRNY